MLDLIMIFYYIITITTWWMTQYYLHSTFISLLSLVPKMFMRIEVLDVVHRLKQHDKYLVYNCFGGIGQKVLANRELGTYTSIYKVCTAVLLLLTYFLLHSSITIYMWAFKATSSQCVQDVEGLLILGSRECIAWPRPLEVGTARYRQRPNFGLLHSRRRRSLVVLEQYTALPNQYAYGSSQ